MTRSSDVWTVFVDGGAIRSFPLTEEGEALARNLAARFGGRVEQTPSNDWQAELCY